MTILYATRGGEAARANQDYVIELAMQQGEELVLLYVANVRFLNRTASPTPLDLIEEELEELGAFLLAMVQERSEAQGVKTTSLIRQGSFPAALLHVIEDYSIDTVVLGSPGEESAVTSPELMNHVIRLLQAETQASVLLVREGRAAGDTPPTG
jgi:nucleotide-binding universal stress UspA family protein